MLRTTCIRREDWLPGDARCECDECEIRRILPKLKLPAWPRMAADTVYSDHLKDAGVGVSDEVRKRVEQASAKRRVRLNRLARAVIYGERSANRAAA